MDAITPQKAQDLEQGLNQGVIAPSSDEQLAAGFLDMSKFPVVAPDGNNDPFLSDFDAQYLFNFDTLACNIFASIGGSEAYLNAILGGKAEFSERAAAVAAGLDGSTGSSEAQWETMINRFGLVKHQDWPFDGNTTKAQFFAPLPQSIIDEGKRFLASYTAFHRQLGTDAISLKEALKYGPVKIFVGTGPGWNKDEKDGTVPKNGNPMSHAVMLRRIDGQGYHIRDHYAPYLKCLAPDYTIYYAFQTLYRKKKFAYVFRYGLQYGMSDPDCVFLQMALALDGEFPPGVPYDQHFGPVTLKAVQDFQVKYGIAKPGDYGYGNCGPKTRAKLNALYGS